MDKIANFWSKHKRNFQILSCIFFFLISAIWAIIAFCLFIDVLNGIGKIFDSSVWQPSNRDLAKVLYLVVAFCMTSIAAKDGNKQLEELTKNNNN